jgi:hypothetical protein
VSHPSCETAGFPVAFGTWSGEVAEGYESPVFHDVWYHLDEWMDRSERIHARGRNRVVTIEPTITGHPVALTVKAYGSPRWGKGYWDAWAGSKAHRAWTTARALGAAGIGTPKPVAFFEERKRGRIGRGFFITEFVPHLTSFRDELIRIYRTSPVCSDLMALLQAVATEVAALHRAGVIHGDLGNQNILLRRTGPAVWSDVQFVDLNRARFYPQITLRLKARDISRITLPSDLLRVFKAMVFGESRPPKVFHRWEDLYRFLFFIHTLTRRWRHPLRERPAARRGDSQPPYPPESDIWIWDDRSGQAISTLLVRDRNRRYPLANALRIGGSNLAAWPAVWRATRRLSRTAFREPADFTGRLALAVEPREGTWDRERTVLEGLGCRLPLMVRFYHHETEREWFHTAAAVRELRGLGYPVSLALVQDRQAALCPARWDRFVERVVGDLADQVEWVEAGHAINRVKWGLWTFGEYRRLLAPVAEAARAHPGLKFMGPAVIDFEYHYLIAALRMLPANFRFQAVSHHLYVDRRGAPENFQGRYDAERKFILGRAIAESSPAACDPRFIVSETNWPLRGTGVYSPVGSPYVMPGPRRVDPSVNEADYGDFMIRYGVLALASGMVDRVYWWRLVAHGFGLVDDQDGGGGWRVRPAYLQLREFLRLFGRSVYQARSIFDDGARVYWFRNPTGRMDALFYSAGKPAWRRLPFTGGRVADGFGRPVEPTGAGLEWSGHPRYGLDVTPDETVSPELTAGTPCP